MRRKARRQSYCLRLRIGRASQQPARVHEPGEHHVIAIAGNRVWRGDDLVHPTASNAGTGAGITDRPTNTDGGRVSNSGGRDRHAADGQVGIRSEVDRKRQERRLVRFYAGGFRHLVVRIDRQHDLVRTLQRDGQRVVDPARDGGTRCQQAGLCDRADDRAGAALDQGRRLGPARLRGAGTVVDGGPADGECLAGY